MRVDPRIAIIACCLLAGTETSAQQLSISGVVRDVHGVVPEVSVSLRGPGGAIRQATTDGSGHYSFDGLIPGRYEASFARDGFATTSRSLSIAGESRTIDVTLVVAGVITTIDVIDVGGKATGSRMGVPDREIPSQISVVSQQTLREQGINDLATALENISGVSVQVQYGVYEWYTIGGYTQQSGNDFLYVDGMTMTGNRPNTQLNNIEEVQVLKGPNAVLYGGAGASQGGMVNIIRKKPQAARTYDLLYRGGRFGRNEAGGGSAGTVFGLQRLLYRVDSQYSFANGWRGAGSERFNVSPSLLWLINDRVRITFSQGLSNDHYNLDGGVPVAVLALPGFPLDRRFNPPQDFEQSRDWQNQIVFDANLTNRLELRNSFFHRRNNDEYYDAETLSYLPATNTVNRSELYFLHHRRPLQNQTDILGTYDFFGTRHAFMIGYDYEDQYNFTNRTNATPGVSASIPIAPIRLADFLNSNFVDPYMPVSGFPRSRVDYSMQAINAEYWQDQINLTKRFRINLAGRYDDWKRRTHNDVYANDVFVSRGAEAGQRHQTSYNYRAGAVYSITDNHVVYFSSASSFHPVNTIPADNKELEPTRSRSYEAGYKWRGWNGRLTATTGARWIIYENLLIPLGGNLFEQAGRAHSKVLDFDLEGDLGSGFRAVANYGYALPVYDDFKSSATGTNLRGNVLVYAPRHTSKVWITKLWRVGENTSLISSLGTRYMAGNT